ncbi:Cytochrome P450 [Nonomuraea solani]|uniref:Cytochrome P450 n=1 Tax=Nonomuraea solani TaxID=1144553 RepID=A0A1H6EFD3_9ACTN|nr:cytochrome P450 [Nonomuraea solani]SEG95515.1 Cytochrome P450 [Nonomuraea solani]
MRTAEAWTAFEALWTPEGRADPYAHYPALRSSGPVFTAGPRRAVVSGYRECEQVLRDPAFRVCDPEWGDREWPGWHDHPSVVCFYTALMHRDPPANQPARKLLSRCFAARAVSEMGSAVRRQVSRHVDRIIELGSDPAGADVIAEFTKPLSMAVLGEFLGLPESDQPMLRDWIMDFAAANEYVPPGGPDLTAADEAAGHLREYLTAHVSAGRGDVIGSMAGEWGPDGRDDLVSNLMFLTAAGTETSTYLLGNGMVRLAADPDLFARLHHRPERAREFMAELVRHDPPILYTARWTGEATTLGGVRLPRHTLLLVLFAAANRDPAVFPDPDRFVLDRFDPERMAADAAQPLSFGHGRHFCPGSAVARLTGETAFRLLAERCERLTRTRPPTRHDGLIAHGHAAAPVAFTPWAFRRPGRRGGQGG